MAASLAVRLIPSLVGRSRRPVATTRPDTAVSRSRTRCRCLGTQTDTARPLVTVLRPNLVTEPTTGTDLGSSTGRDRITDREVTDTRRAATAPARPAIDLRPGMGQSTVQVPATVQAPATATDLVQVPGLVLVPGLAMVRRLVMVPVLAIAASLGTGLIEDLTRRADTDRPADTGATVAGLVPMSSIRGTGTGRETTTAQPPDMARRTASDQALAMVLALATHQAVPPAERTVREMATDTVQERDPNAGTTRAVVQATRVGPLATTMARATATTSASGTALEIRVAATDTDQRRVTDTDRRGGRGRRQAHIRAAAATSAVITSSAMSSDRRTTAETGSTGDQRATGRPRPMPYTARAGRPRPATTVCSGRTGRTQTPTDLTVRSIRPAAGTRGRRTMATATVHRGSTVRSPTGQSTHRLGLVPPTGRLTSGRSPRQCSATGRPPRCLPAQVRQPLNLNQPPPRRPTSPPPTSVHRPAWRGSARPRRRIRSPPLASPRLLRPSRSSRRRERPARPAMSSRRRSRLYHRRRCRRLTGGVRALLSAPRSLARRPAKTWPGPMTTPRHCR